MAGITLHYFDFYSRGEVIRLILTYHGLDFVDHRVDLHEWPALCSGGISEFNQLPVLEIDGLRLVESRSISRYLCQKLGYYPSDRMDIYWVESICDLREDIYCAVAKAIESNDNEELEKVYKEHIPWWLQKIENRLSRNNEGNGWFVGESVTRADFEVFELIWDGMLRPGMKDRFGYLLSAAPKLEAFMQRFLASSTRLQEYLDSRPVCTY
jgi:glutathione S-transferase